MAGFTERLALGVVGLALAVLSSGCAWWDRGGVVSATSAVASSNAMAPAAAAAAALPRPSPAVISNESEDFVCLDGSRLRVDYLGSRDIVAVSLNGAAPIAMRRADESELTAYRAENLVFRRSGVRVALANDVASVTVESGDTLGLISMRVYGDRSHAMDIARLNNLENPDLIFPGQLLSLPQVERRCRRALYQQASLAVEAGPEQPRPLNRRLFSSPSERQIELRRTLATASDPPRR